MTTKEKTEETKPLKFEILSPTDENFSNKIKFNFEELKGALSLRLEKYKNLTYTEDQIKLAKKDKASLNAFKNNIETERKRIKREVNRFYEEEFKPQVDEIVALIDKPIKEIDSQIKAYEEDIKNKKITEIEEFFNANNTISALKVEFNSIYKPEWSNLTSSTKKIKEEVLEIIEKIKTDLSVIFDFQSKYEVSLINEYQKAYRLDDVIRLKKSLQEREELIKKCQETDEEKPSEKIVKVSTSETSKPIYYKKSFEVKATKDDLIAIQNLFNSRNIEYRIIG